MKTKRVLYIAGIALAVIVTTSINATETKAGIFGQKGNPKPIFVPIEYDGELIGIGVEYDCMYSLKSICDRS